MPDAGSKFKGKEGEQYAEAYLQGQGLFLVERNYRCRFGEIDLIMREGKVVVFIEVRMRASQAFGGAASSITLSKQGKLMRTARLLSRLAKIGSRVPIRCGFVVRGQGGRNGMDKKCLL